jgi:hypothetical protein
MVQVDGAAALRVAIGAPCVRFRGSGFLAMRQVSRQSKCLQPAVMRGGECGLSALAVGAYATRTGDSSGRRDDFATREMGAARKNVKSNGAMHRPWAVSHTVSQPTRPMSSGDNSLVPSAGFTEGGSPLTPPHGRVNDSGMTCRLPAAVAAEMFVTAGVWKPSDKRTQRP